MKKQVLGKGNYSLTGKGVKHGFTPLPVRE